MRIIKLKSILLSESPNPSEYWGLSGAGCIVISKSTHKFLFGCRSDEVQEPGTWGGFGGKVDGDDSPLETAKREFEEETGFNGQYSIKKIYILLKTQINLLIITIFFWSMMNLFPD